MSTPEVTPDTFRDRVRAARAAAQHRHTKDFEIPGFEGTIWGTFRALDKWADVRGIIERHSSLDETEQQVNVAAETLLRSCVTLYGVDGAHRAPLNMGLGVQFAEYVEEGSTASPDGIPMTDLQAVFVAIPNEVQLVMLYTSLEKWYEGMGAKTDVEQVGNSVAPS